MRYDTPEWINAKLTITCSNNHPTRFLMADEEDDDDDPVAVCPGCGGIYSIEIDAELMTDEDTEE